MKRTRPVATLLVALFAAACTEPNPNAEGEATGESGDAESTDSSESTTGPAVCGDGMVEGDEACDEGAANDDNGECKSDCTQNVCGDGFQSPTEECDAGGSNGDNASCTNACELARCGDGLLGPDEQCDEGDGNNANEAACKADCTDNVCGDGFAGPGEECDDGNQDETDACRSNCRALASPTCMDDAVLPGEWCFSEEVEGTLLFAPGDVEVYDIDGDGQDDLFSLQAGEYYARWVLSATDTFVLGHELDLTGLGEPTYGYAASVLDYVPAGQPELMLFGGLAGDTFVEVWQQATSGPDLVETAAGAPDGLTGVTVEGAATLQLATVGPETVVTMDPAGPTVYAASGTGAPTALGVEGSGPMFRLRTGEDTDVLMVISNETTQVARLYRLVGSVLQRDQLLTFGNTSETIVATAEVGDIDGDGDDDLVTVSAENCPGPDTSTCTENTLRVYTGEAAVEPLSEHADQLVGFGVNAVTFGDFNLDGAPDIVVARQGTQDLLVLETEGSALTYPYTRTIPMTIGANVRLIKGDFNGDGHLDLIVHNSSGTENTSTVLWSQP